MEALWDSGHSVATEQIIEVGFTSDEEHFVGEGQANFVETSATRMGNMLSRLITEKDLLDTMFHVIGPDEYGKVPASKLIEIIKMTMNGDYDELELVLDPMGFDMAIDLETFKSAVQNWDGKQNPCDLFFPQTSTPLNSPKKSRKLNNSFEFADLNFLHVSSSDDGKMDTNTLENEISQLKFKNSKLEKENRELENQNNNLEICYTNVQAENESFRHRCQSLQNQIESLQNEIDCNSCKYADESKKWEKEKSDLITERNDFERQVKSLKDELTDTINELTTIRISEEDLRRNYLEREAAFIHAVYEKNSMEEKVSLETNACAEFRECLLETLRNNEQLRKKRHDLQEEVYNLCEQLCMNKITPELQESEDDDAILDLTLDNQQLTLTPMIRHNFDRESSIFEELMLDSHQESSFSQTHPICGKPPTVEPYAPQNYEWDYLENIEFLLQQISSQLDEVCAVDLVDGCNVNHNDSSSTNKIKAGPSGKLDERIKSRVGFDENALDLDANLEASPQSLSPETLRCQINTQLKMLRLQITKSQNILTCLQSKSMPLVVKSSQNSPIEPFPSSEFSSSQASCHHTKINKSSWTSSQDSTPKHNRIRTRSCPILPSETTFITKGTQTEPTSTHANNRLQQTVNHKMLGTPVISITSDMTEYDLETVLPMPRVRTSSYSEAIKHGNKEDNTEESEDFRLNRRLSVLKEEEHENSNSSSPLTHRAKPVFIVTHAQPRCPPPYRPPPPPRPFQSWENVSRPPTIQVQYSSSKSLEALSGYPRIARESPVSLTSQRLRPDAPIRQSSDPFPAQEQNQPNVFPSQLMPSVYHSMSVQTLDYSDPCYQEFSDTRLFHVPCGIPSPVVGVSPTLSDREIGTESRPVFEPVESLARIELQQQHLPIEASMATISDSGNDTATEKISDDADESMDDCCKKVTRVGNRRRKRSSGSTGNNSPAIQRSKAIDFDFGDEVVNTGSCKDDSDVDVKKDILQGMTQVTNRGAFSPPPLSGTPEFIISTSPKSSAEIHQPSFRRKVGESQKNRLLMPELMENSETESAKNSGGSMESETEQAAPSSTDIVTPPPPCGDGAYPSLPDSFLKVLQLHKSNEKVERLSEKDVEAKFHSLLLGFRTDRFTLSNRLELHQRQRDIAEKNIDEEIIALKENLNALSQLCNDQETREIVKRLHHHLDVLHQSTARMSSRAEVYGAVQQEDRTNRAIEVMLLYVENLKRVQEKSSADFEEMRRVMIENNLLTEDGSESEDTRRNLRSHSMSNSSIGKQASKRRASIAALPRSTSERLDGNTKFINFVNTSRNSVCSIGSRRCSLYYNLRCFSSSDPDKMVKKQAADDLLVPSSSSVEHSDDEHLHRPKRLPPSRRGSKRDSLIPKNNIDKQSPTADIDLSKASNAGVGEREKPDSLDSNNQECVLANGTENHSVRCRANWHNNEYPTEPSSDEDDDVIDATIRPVNSTRFRPRNMADTAASLLSLSQWVNDEHLFHGVRYTIGAILFLAALFSLLIAFFPGSNATHSCSQFTSWYSIDELFRPHLEIHRPMRQPI